MTTGTEILTRLSDTVARLRRAKLRLVGTEQEESLRALAEALVAGAHLDVCQWLEAGRILIVRPKGTSSATAYHGFFDTLMPRPPIIYFASAQERNDFFVAFIAAGEAP
jgi:hypothetical protein